MAAAAGALIAAVLVPFTAARRADPRRRRAVVPGLLFSARSPAEPVGRAMTWTAIAVPWPGAPTRSRCSGSIVLGPRADRGTALRAAALLPAALLPALVVVGTLAGDRAIEVDARAAGLVVAGIAVWRRAPFWLTVTLAAAVTALVRAAPG